MEAVLMTLVVILLMVAALVMLAWSWPPSSRLGGYRAMVRGGAQDRPAQAREGGEANREEDDIRWRWDDPEDGGRA